MIVGEMDNEEMILVNAFAVVLTEIIDELDISQAELARRTGIPSPHLTEMKKGRRACSAETSLRLAAYFGTSEAYWLRLYVDYEIRKAKIELSGKLPSARDRVEEVG